MYLLKKMLGLGKSELEKSLENLKLPAVLYSIDGDKRSTVYCIR